MMLSINPAQARIYRADTERSKVYYSSDTIIVADIKTFTIVNHNFAKDKKHVYLGGEILGHADPNTSVRLSTDLLRENCDDYQVISYSIVPEWINRQAIVGVKKERD